MELLGANDMRKQYSTPDWLLGGLSPDAPGILPGAALVMVYGAYKCLKTFTLLDIALCIPAGRDWHGHPVKQGPVVYVVAEDPHYIMTRVDAWGAHHGVDVGSIPFFMVPGSVQMLEQGEMEPELDDIDVGAITPIDALNLLFLLQKKRNKR